MGSRGAGSRCVPMNDDASIADALVGILQELLEKYDAHVPEQGIFKDLRAGRPVHYGDPTTTLQGRLELSVMHMDAELDRKYNSLRFLAIRVWKSRIGGMASSSCLHNDKATLRREMEKLVTAPGFLVARVQELADGLPEATNPDIWR